LFETIHGQEVENIYHYIKKYGNNYPLEKLYDAFIPKDEDGNISKTQNVNSAISFLRSADFIEGRDLLTAAELPFENFKISLLKTLRDTELVKKRTSNELDPYFLRIISKLFIEPNRRFLSSENLHKFANNIGNPSAINPTKLGNWKSFMEYLGLGFRDQAGGFYCNYNDDIIIEILRLWNKEEGTIQSLLEQHFDNFLPWKDNQDGLSSICQEAFLRLQNRFLIRMEEKQDLAVVAYFPQRYKSIEVLLWA